MTGPPAFSDTPQGSKTAGNTGSSPESDAFIAECAEPVHRPYTVQDWQRDTFPRRTQTVHITLTVDIPGDLRAAADGALRREFPRGKWEVTDAD